MHKYSGRTMGSLQELFETDQEFQIGFRASAEVASDQIAREECFVKAARALDREEQLLESIDPKFFDIVLQDVAWKHAIMDSIPIDPSDDQLRAIHVLVKSRPFLSQLNLGSA